MEDDKIAALEAQLAQAKQIAEEADKKYDEVRLALPGKNIKPAKKNSPGENNLQKSLLTPIGSLCLRLHLSTRRQLIYLCIVN